MANRILSYVFIDGVEFALAGHHPIMVSRRGLVEHRKLQMRKKQSINWVDCKPSQKKPPPEL